MESHSAQLYYAQRDCKPSSCSRQVDLPTSPFISHRLCLSSQLVQRDQHLGAKKWGQEIEFPEILFPSHLVSGPDPSRGPGAQAHTSRVTIKGIAWVRERLWAAISVGERLSAQPVLINWKRIPVCKLTKNTALTTRVRAAMGIRLGMARTRACLQARGEPQAKPAASEKRPQKSENFLLHFLFSYLESVLGTWLWRASYMQK